MIKTYYFVGKLSSIGERVYDSLGQRAQFTDEQYRDIILGGAPFIPEENFKKIGLTAEDIAAFGHAGSWDLAPDSFRSKVYLAEQVFRDIRQRMLREEDVASQIIPPQEILVGEKEEE